MTGNFYPSFSYVIDITNALEAVVTFSDPHEFTDGELVSFRVSKSYGMFEINNRRGRVLASTDSTITVEIDTSSMTPFVYRNPIVGTPPIVVPAGSGIIPELYPPTVSLIDSFDDRP